MAVFRIFIADDHEVVRKGLCALLQAEAGWEICGRGVGRAHRNGKNPRTKTGCKHPRHRHA